MLLLSYKVIGKRNKIFDFNYKQISYVEIIKNDNSTMTTINDSAKLKKIAVYLNKISGEEVKLDVNSAESSDIDFINVYDRSFKKTEIARFGFYLRVNSKDYRINKRGSAVFDDVLNIYN